MTLIWRIRNEKLTMNIKRFFLKKKLEGKQHLPIFNGKLNKKKKAEQFDRYELNDFIK